MEGTYIFLQTIIQGILVGMLYALIGVGMTLIMGVMGIINLAHGELMVLAMYISWVLNKYLSLSPYVSLIFVAPFLFFVGLFIGRYLLMPFMEKESILPENQVLMTVGIGIVITETLRSIFTSDYRSLKTSISQKVLFIGEISLSYPYIIAFIFTLIISGALFWFLSHTDLGRAIRATAQNKEAAMLMGINTKLLTYITYAIGAFLVAIAGVLIFPALYLYPDMGGIFTVKAFIITILGGLGCTIGAIFAGITIGIAEALGATYISMEFKDVISMLIFLVALLIFPQGFSPFVRKYILKSSV